MKVAELNQQLQFIKFKCDEDLEVFRELLEEAKVYIEEDRILDNTTGWPGQLSRREMNQRDADYNVIVKILEESGE